MKSHNLLIGSLVLSLTVLVGPSPVAALSPLCTDLLERTPISPYVQKVLQRAEAGRAYTAEHTSLSRDDAFALSRKIESAYLAAVQTVDLGRDLSDVTACQRIDELFLTCEIDRLYDAALAALAQDQWTRIEALTEGMGFLAARIGQFRTGALDPLYPDTSWSGRTTWFDPPNPIFCCLPSPDDSPDASPPDCAQMEEQACLSRGGRSYPTLDLCSDDICGRGRGGYSLEEEMCPFHSDYAPWLQSGYGCDATVLEPFKDIPGVKEEFAAQRALTDALQTSVARDDLTDLLRQVDDLINPGASVSSSSSSSSSSVSSREHRRAFGCSWRGGYCSGDATVRCTVDLDCAPPQTCTIPSSICEKNRHIACIDSAQCRRGESDEGPCIPDDGVRTGRTAARFPFSLDRSHLTFLRQFILRRIGEGRSRQFRQALRNVSDYPLYDTENRARVQSEGDLVAMMRSDMRTAVRSWGIAQGLREAALYPIVPDSELTVAMRLSELRSANSALASSVVTKTSSIRAFVARFSSFLLRSCIYRPCAKSLNEVLRLVTTDACFPYTNGEYLTDPEASVAEQCMKKAGVRE